MEDEYCEYLIIGGARHGQIVSWLGVRDELFLPNINHLNIGQDGFEPIEERFHVRRHFHAERGRSYLLASNVGFENHDLDGIIQNSAILPIE